MTTVTYAKQKKANLPAQILAALLGGIFLFSLVITAWVVGYSFWYAGYIFPGVSVAGVNLSGMNPSDAALKLNQTLTYPNTGRILFKDGDQYWVASPGQLGMVFDPGATARAAYQIGRNEGIINNFERQLSSWQFGVDIAPVFMLDERVAFAYLQAIASQLDQPVIEAGLAVQGTEIVVQPGQIGRVLDIEGTMVFLTAQMRSFRDGEVPLVIREFTPEIMDVTEVADQAKQILQEPLTLHLQNAQEGEPGPWVVDLPTLASLLEISRYTGTGGPGYEISFNEQGLRPLISEIAEDLYQQPKNARFIFNDDTRQLDLLEAAATGREVDIEATLLAIKSAIKEGQKNVGLVIRFQDPAVRTDATAEQLGIRELVSSQTSYFYGSSTARIQNIQTAAASFHGILIAPGETYSMGEALGDISLDNGYAEALIIYGNRTIKGVGGGVCQVSTTLFRTVFFGGFPIVERHAHAYRVYYYEQKQGGGINTNFAGLDATVYFPLVDFKFTNDTPYWLLMETYVNASARRITWKFYSTSDGRTVQWETTGPQNVEKPPDPLFQENPDLAKDQIKQVDWAAEGADVIVTRTVYRSGQVLHRDTVRTHYRPWRAIYEYGPGTENPEKLVGNQ